MSELVERVAKARWTRRMGFCCPWEQVTAEMKAVYRNDVKTDIAAMREPTVAMTAAGWQHTGDPCWQSNVADAWRAMVDAALAEEPQP